MFHELLLQLLTFFVVPSKQVSLINQNSILDEIHYWTVCCCAPARTDESTRKSVVLRVMRDTHRDRVKLFIFVSLASQHHS